MIPALPEDHTGDLIKNIRERSLNNFWCAGFFGGAVAVGFGGGDEVRGKGAAGRFLGKNFRLPDLP